MTKQTLTFLKTQKFIQTYPNILFFQHNNLSVSQWFRLRRQLKSLENVNLFLLKNTFVDIILTEENVENPFLFQGPCFALGFSNSSQFSEILKITRQEPTIVLIGGLFAHQFLTHLDLSKLVTLDNQIHERFLTNLNQSLHLQETLRNSLFQPLTQFNQVSWNFLHCLEILKTKR